MTAFFSPKLLSALKYHHIAPLYPFLDMIADLKSWLKGESYSAIRITQHAISKIVHFLPPPCLTDLPAAAWRLEHARIQGSWLEVQSSGRLSRDRDRAIGDAREGIVWVSVCDVGDLADRPYVRPQAPNHKRTPPGLLLDL